MGSKRRFDNSLPYSILRHIERFKLKALSAIQRNNDRVSEPDLSDGQDGVVEGSLGAAKKL